MVAQHMEASPGVIEQRMRVLTGTVPQPLSVQVCAWLAVSMSRDWRHACAFHQALLATARYFAVIPRMPMNAHRLLCRLCVSTATFFCWP